MKYTRVQTIYYRHHHWRNIPGDIVEVSVQNVSYNWMLPLSGTYNSKGLWTTSAFRFSVYSSDILGGLPLDPPA